MTFEEFEKTVRLVNDDVVYLDEEPFVASFERRSMIRVSRARIPNRILEPDAYEQFKASIKTNLVRKLWHKLREDFSSGYSVDDLKKAYYFGQMDLHQCRSFEQALKEIDRQREQA